MSYVDEDEELARLEAELAALRGAPAASSYTSSNFPPSYESSSSSYSTTGASSVPVSSASQTLLQAQQKEMEELKRQLAEAQSSKPAPSPASISSASQTLLQQQQREMEEIKRQLAEAQSSKPAAPSASQTLLQQQQREMEELKRQLAAAQSSKPAAPSASQTLLQQQQREMEEMRNQLALAQQQKEMDELRRQLSASQGGGGGSPASASFSSPPSYSYSPSSSPASAAYSASAAPSMESQRRLDQQKAETEALKAKLAAMKAAPSPSSSPSPSTSPYRETGPSTLSSTASTKSAVPDTYTREMAEQQRKLEEIERKKKELENAAPSISTVAGTASRNAEKEKELKELQRKLNSGTTVAALEAQRTAARSEYEKKAYGVDVCFVMDCTGSMSSWINAAREKIFELAREIPNIKSSRTPHLRIGFVGYRDHCDGADRIALIEFFDLNDQVAVANFQTSLKSVPAKGGGDTPEDIAGGLDNALNNMAWSASTKLIIHFADAPCHGSKYHPYDDSYPGGDPYGLVPEDILDKFISRSITYYFGEINSSTKQMTDIFAAHMSSRNKTDMFIVLPMSTGASLFLPAVVRSITSTMAKSGIFGMTT